jgi:hypothetical protein
LPSPCGQPPALAGWRSFEIPQSRTSLDYPAGSFSPAGASEKGFGERFQSHDQGAALSVYAQPRKAGETPASYLQNNLQIPPSAIETTRIGRTARSILDGATWPEGRNGSQPQQNPARFPGRVFDSHQSPGASSYQPHQ